MDYRRLGASGLKASPLCLGTMKFAARTEEAEAARILDLAREAGVNFIDTADAYAKGAGEEMVGRLIKADRESWVLASKAANPMGPGPNQRGLGRKWLMTAVDDSLCGHHGIGVAPYSPLARGVLTGKYEPGAPPPEATRAGRQDRRMMETEFRPESLEIAQQVEAHAEGRGMTPGQWALLWVLANPLVTAPIAGPRTAEQWTENLGALRHDWTAEDEAFLDSLVPPGHPSTPGYSDPQYPITGRPVGVRGDRGAGGAA
jgi:aryl-alcohol dehydrogenase-like predicted oxidoreductase